MSIVIHHNPDCGTSRNVLAIIEASGKAVLDLLNRLPSVPIAKEDGTPLIDSKGTRIG